MFKYKQRLIILQTNQRRILTFKNLILVLCLTLFLSIYVHADEKTYESLRLFTDVLETLEENYVDKIDSEELIHNAIKGMVGYLDPHSSFMLPNAFKDLQDETKGEFSGIGIEITIKDGIITIISPIEGTPAYKVGIKAGDIIIKIDDKSTKNMELLEAVKMLRGPKNKTVRITIIRKNMTSPIEFSIKRDTIPYKSVKSEILKPGFGYLRVSSFRKTTYNEIIENLKTLETKDKDLKGLVLDLRNNPGGLLEQAIKVSDLFLEKGNIVLTKGRRQKNTKQIQASSKTQDRKYPLVVLINAGSASAAEIIAGALQDNLRALIIGKPSFGKGSVQAITNLKNGFGLKYTVARYYTPNGRSIQEKGIHPDIEVDFKVLEDLEEKKNPSNATIKEKNLKNSLKPKQLSKSEPKALPKKLSQKTKLLKDSQIKRALELLMGYKIFSKLNRK